MTTTKKELLAARDEVRRLEREIHKEKVAALAVEREKLQPLVAYIHDNLCQWNHTDGCGWGYEDDDWTAYAHAQWTEKVYKVLDGKTTVADVKAFVLGLQAAKSECPRFIELLGRLR